MAEKPVKKQPAAKKSKPTVYEVTIAGEYYAEVRGGTELKPYQVTLKMNQEHKEAGFLSVFRNLVAPQTMRAQYSDYGGGLSTHRVISVIDVENPDGVLNDPTLMTLPQLLAFIGKNELPITVALYGDEDALKQAVVDCLTDEDSFVEAQAKRQDLRGASLELANQLSELNPGMSPGLSISQAQLQAKSLDLTKIPDAEDAYVPPVAKPNNGTTEDRLTLDVSGGKKEIIGGDDFDL